MTVPAPQAPARGGVVAPRRRPLGHLVPLRVIDAGEDLLHVAIGLILFGIAVVVLVHAVQDLAHAHPLFPVA
jgi:hypothetical protein